MFTSTGLGPQSVPKYRKSNHSPALNGSQQLRFPPQLNKHPAPYREFSRDRKVYFFQWEDAHSFTENQRTLLSAAVRAEMERLSGKLAKFRGMYLLLIFKYGRWHQICSFLFFKSWTSHPLPPLHTVIGDCVTLSARVLGSGEELLVLTYFSEWMTTHPLPGMKILFPHEEDNYSGDKTLSGLASKLSAVKRAFIWTMSKQTQSERVAQNQWA